MAFLAQATAQAILRFRVLGSCLCPALSCLGAGLFPGVVASYFCFADKENERVRDSFLFFCFYQGCKPQNCLKLISQTLM